ncbi:hypothetical protein BJV74DRAFT_794493 [Russula compacta]|nr:hypothetical protein BJV74DRAFT_794493 [Russula compacta]
MQLNALNSLMLAFPHFPPRFPSFDTRTALYVAVFGYSICPSPLARSCVLTVRRRAVKRGTARAWRLTNMVCHESSKRYNCLEPRGLGSARGPAMSTFAGQKRRGGMSQDRADTILLVPKTDIQKKNAPSGNSQFNLIQCIALRFSPPLLHPLAVFHRLDRGAEDETRTRAVPVAGAGKDRGTHVSVAMYGKKHVESYEAQQPTAAEREREKVARGGVRWGRNKD